MVSDFLKSLVSKGYLPQEIVPWIHSNELAYYLDDIINDISTFTEKKSLCSRYSIPKGRHHRRVLGIPNPLHYIELCKVIDDNWTSIKRHVASSSMSLTTPSIRGNSLRALSRKFSFSEIAEKLVSSSTSSRYMLKTDISKYYSSIYTHSIAWALHTKEVAKRNKRDMTLYGNLIDNHIQRCQDWQTNGIPIGPDTSLIISEIICVAMDQLVNKGITYKNAFRYIDDYYLFFDKFSDAERAFSELHKITKEYGLELNSSKTKIIELPEPLEPIWVSELSKLPHSYKEILSYISKAFNFSKQYPNDEVLKYSLVRLREVKIGNKAWKLIQPYVQNVLIHEPSAIPIASEMLFAAYQSGQKVDKNSIYETISEVIRYHATYGNDFEVCWSLWLCAILDLKIDNSIIKCISSIENQFVALIALDLKNKGLIDGELDLGLWESLMIKEELYGENWILAYEAYIRNWLPSKNGDDYITSDPFFSVLKSKDIHFFDINAIKNWKSISYDKKWLFSDPSPAF